MNSSVYPAFLVGILITRNNKDKKNRAFEVVTNNLIPSPESFIPNKISIKDTEPEMISIISTSKYMIDYDSQRTKVTFFPKITFSTFHPAFNQDSACV